MSPLPPDRVLPPQPRPLLSVMFHALLHGSVLEAHATDPRSRPVGNIQYVQEW